MISKYVCYTNITKEILDFVEVGDLVKINDWKKPLRVKGVSPNYFVMATKQFGVVLYSVCEKKQWGGTQHNAMRGGAFHCGRDSWIFGWGDGYNFDDVSLTAEYLESFEKGESELSARSAVPILSIEIKKCGKRKGGISK